MSKRVFLDANVVLDFLDGKRAKNSQAVSLVKYLVINEWTIVISEDMLSTIFYIDKNSDRVLYFFKKISKDWQIIPFGMQVISDSISRALDYNLDLEDILQCLCAKENGCEVLITNDNKFHDCGLSIQTVDAFLHAVESCE